jgi:hypothetical protein
MTEKYRLGRQLQTDVQVGRTQHTRQMGGTVTERQTNRQDDRQMNKWWHDGNVLEKTEIRNVLL